MAGSMTRAKHQGPLGALLALLLPFWYGPDRKYFPEEHYMRGPGPKWREKHSAESGQADS